MSFSGSDPLYSEYGSNYKNNKDVVQATALANRFENDGRLELADKIRSTIDKFITAWNNVINALSGEFPTRYYDPASNRWKDSITNQFATSPNNDTEFTDRARELRLID